MRCEQFESRLHDLLDERRPPERDARLQAHAAGCRDCRDLLQVQSRLFYELPCAADGDAVADRILAAVRPATRPARRASRIVLQRAAIAASLVAVLAVVVSLRFTESPANVDVPEPPRIVVTAKPVETPTSSDDLPATWPFALTTLDAESLEPLADGLRPIANTFSVAFDAIRESIALDLGETEPVPGSL